MAKKFKFTNLEKQRLIQMKMLPKFKITECRYFLQEHSPISYPNIYAFIKHYVEAYDNHESQYVIRDNRK